MDLEEKLIIKNKDLYFMRTLLYVIVALLAICLVPNIFVWIIAQVTGHDIPRGPNISFAVRSLVLLLLFIISILIANRIKRKDKHT